MVEDWPIDFDFTILVGEPEGPEADLQQDFEWTNRFSHQSYHYQ